MRLFSIITVCLNVENEIRNTILSVLGQDCDKFEYIVQDGESSDQTVEIAKIYTSAFEDRGIPFHIISQKDKGVYDAMNAAVQKAKGQWIIFMNAGDCFANKNVLSQVIKKAHLETSDVIYGDVISRNNYNEYRYEKTGALDGIRFSMIFCHQSIFTKKTLLEEVPFSIKYRICSDYLFFLQMYCEGKKFEYIPIAIAIFNVNGLSSDKVALNEEMVQILEKMPVRDEEAIQFRKKILKQSVKKKFIKDHFGYFIPEIIHQIRRKKFGWKTEEELRSFLSDE